MNRWVLVQVCGIFGAAFLCSLFCSWAVLGHSYTGVRRGAPGSGDSGTNTGPAAVCAHQSTARPWEMEVRLLICAWFLLVVVWFWIASSEDYWSGFSCSRFLCVQQSGRAGLVPRKDAQSCAAWSAHQGAICLSLLIILSGVHVVAACVYFLLDFDWWCSALFSVICLVFFLSCVLIGAVPVYFFWSGSEAVFRTSSFMVSARFYWFMCFLSWPFCSKLESSSSIVVLVSFGIFALVLLALISQQCVLSALLWKGQSRLRL